MPTLTAVADSTVLVSAFIRKGGVADVLLREAAGGVFELCLSQEIITETQTVLLEREHLRRRYPYTNEDVTEFRQFLQRSFSLVTELPQLTGIVRDPNDDMIVATAQRAQAAYIMTRDDDLLALQRYEDITIITPEAFMALVRERRRDTSAQ
jgi:putative PIN family toxin of toxin-antitoxin system